MEDGDPKAQKGHVVSNMKKSHYNYNDCSGNSLNGQIATEKMVSHRGDCSGRRNERVLCHLVSKTVVTYAIYAALGMTESVLGLTLVTMGYLLSANTAEMAFTMAGFKTGYCLGAVICGTIHKRVPWFPTEPQLFVAGLLMSACLLVVPLCQQIITLTFVTTLLGTGSGFIDVASNPYLLTMWADFRVRDSILQALHGIWALGGFITPFIVAPFLTDIPHHCLVDDAFNQPPELNESTISYSISSSYNISLDAAVNGTLQGCNDIVSRQDVERVWIAFMLISLIVFVISLVILCLYVALRNTQKHSSILVERNAEENEISMLDKTTNGEVLNNEEEIAMSKSETIRSSSSKMKMYTLGLLTVVIIYNYFYFHLNCVPITFLATFTIKGLGWHTTQAANITSIFFLMIMIGRFLGAPVSYILSPRTILISNHIIVISAYTVVQFIKQLGDLSLYISMVMAGLGISTMAASTILFLSEHIPFTPTISALNMVGNTVGATVANLLGGYLFEKYGHMSMMYLLLVVSCVHCLWFAVVYVVAVFAKPKEAKQIVSSCEVE